MNELRHEFRISYGSRILVTDDCRDIFLAFCEYSEKCRIEESTLEQLMSIMNEKTDEKVTYQDVDDLIFQYFIEQDVEDTNQNIDSQHKEEEQQIPHNTEEIRTFIVLCQQRSPHETTLSVADVNKIAKQIQQETGVTLSYINEIISLAQSDDKINVKDLKRHFGIVDNRAAQLTIETNISPQSVMSSMRNLSTTKNFNMQLVAGEGQIKALFNIAHQRIDRMRRYIGKSKQLDKLLKDFTRMMRRIEDETDMMEEEFKKKNPDESEEAENHVLDLELEVRRYQEQVSQMIDDNESLIRSLQDAEEEVILLKMRVQSSERSFEDELSNRTYLESELGRKEVDIRSGRQEVQLLTLEMKHLQDNNKTLMDMVQGLEEQQQSAEQVNNRAQNSEAMNQAFKEERALHSQQQQQRISQGELNKCLSELQYYKDQLMGSQGETQKLEMQLLNYKREQLKQQILYDNANEEISHQRQSIARLSVIGLGGGVRSGMTRQSIAYGAKVGGSSLAQQLMQSKKIIEIQEQSDEGTESDGGGSSASDKRSLSTTNEDLISIKDHLKIVDEECVREILREEKQKYELTFQRILTCDVTIGVRRGDDVTFKEQKILMLTDYQVLLLNVDFSTHDTKFIARLNKIQLNQTNPKVCSFCIDQDIILFSSAHRSDITVFLTDAFIMRKLTLFKQEHVRDVVRKQSTIEVVAKVTQTNLFRMEYGDLWQQQTWKKYFLMLSNVGILVFNEPCDFVPHLFIPLNDMICIKSPQVNDEDVPNGIKISRDVNLEYVFRFTTPNERNEWFDKIKLIQKQFLP